MVKVFVYGTLKQGHGNHAVYLNNQQSEFLGNASIEGYDLFDLGPFPAIVPQLNPSSNRVFGELYEVTSEVAHRLDSLEGFNPKNPSNGLYNKAGVTVLLEDGLEHPDVLVYFMQKVPDRSKHIEQGVW